MMGFTRRLDQSRRSYVNKVRGRGVLRGNGALALILIVLVLTLNIPGIIFAPISLPIVLILGVLAVFCIATVILIPLVFGIY
jgi:hypothetical protein